MKILTAAEMREADRRTIEEHGVSSLTLMEHAGAAVARFALREMLEDNRGPVLALCGKGNNGGDGLVAARHLAAAGVRTSVLLLGSRAELKGDPAAMAARLPAHVRVVEAPTPEALDSDEVRELLGGATLLLDALVGTGFQPPLRGVAAALRDRVHATETPVLAVDLPSGWNADAMEYRAESAMRADAVVSFTAPKLAHVCGNLTNSAGKPIVIAPIGSPDDAVHSDTRLRWAGASRRIAEQPREADDNKGRHGHVALFAGSHGKAGAPSMAALAALRAGAGLVTAAVPESVLNTVALVAPELMTTPLPETRDGDLDQAFFGEALDALLHRKTLVAVGPGLGESDGAKALVRALLAKADVPLVLDADALNIVAQELTLLADRRGVGRPVVLTPHPGEMGRLVGKSVKEVQADRLGIARRFAAEYGVTLVLKGWRTLIAHPDGTVAVNTTGNPGMAKGGSGDMLTGIVAALLAQYPQQPGAAVEAAVYLHGLAADFAVRSQDEHTLLVTDVLASLWKAFRFRASGKDGYVWLEGLPKGAFAG